MSPGHTVFSGEQQCREQGSGTKEATGATVESQRPGNTMGTSEKFRSGDVRLGPIGTKPRDHTYGSLQDGVSRTVDNCVHPCSSSFSCLRITCYFAGNVYAVLLELGHVKGQGRAVLRTVIAMCHQDHQLIIKYLGAQESWMLSLSVPFAFSQSVTKVD